MVSVSHREPTFTPLVFPVPPLWHVPWICHQTRLQTRMNIDSDASLNVKTNSQPPTNHMTRKYITTGAFLTAAVLSLAVVPRSFGQAAAQPTTPASTETTEEVVKLSPFVVDASADQTGYKANTTLAGTRVRSDLKDIASSISVVTQQFLQDTGAKNNADLLVYTPSTEVAGIRGNFTGIAGAPVYQENTVNVTTRVRGLDSADNTRNLTTSPTSRGMAITLVASTCSAVRTRSCLVRAVRPASSIPARTTPPSRPPSMLKIASINTAPSAIRSISTRFSSIISSRSGSPP